MRLGGCIRAGAAALALAAAPRAGTAADVGRVAAAAPGRDLVMEKYVTPDATWALYRPRGWKVEETPRAGLRAVSVSDPAGRYRVTSGTGKAPADADLLDVAGPFVRSLREAHRDLELTRAWRSPDGSRVSLEGRFTDARAGPKEFRLWLSRQKGGFAVTSASAPRGRLVEARPLLLTIAGSVRPLRAAGRAPTARPLVERRLADGSASFRLPPDWTVQDLGRTSFVAGAPGGAGGFLSGNVEVIDPRLGVRPPGVPVAPYQPPHRALAMLIEAARLGSDFRFLEVHPLRDIDEAGRAGQGGEVRGEAFLYTFRDAQGRPSKGFSFGVSFGSRLGASWHLWHVTVVAPVGDFDALGPTFAEMVASYRIDQAYARRYVEQGQARLRAMQRETARKTADAARSIRETMQSAYDERQRSRDYIDYLETNNIRGQTDWISEVEGGAVYHTDSWGTKNTVTGETWEGAPFDQLHFEGKNPKYHELMQPVDSRALWERYAR
jgi:hypothetical protein